jgi:type II secretory pathway component PulL
MQLDLNKAALALGVGASIIAMITAWNEVNFRLEKMEEKQELHLKQVEQQEQEIDKLRSELNGKGEQLKCLICSVHNMGCLGC